MELHRYFIYLAYDGTLYHGWQVQPNGISVQETLTREAISAARKKAVPMEERLRPIYRKD